MFDCVKLGAVAVCDVIKELLANASVTKLFHDVHNDAVALASIGNITLLSGTLDTQLAMEALTGDLHIGFNQMLEQLELPRHSTKDEMKDRMRSSLKTPGKSLFEQRPLPPDVLRYAADDVDLLVNVKVSLQTSTTRCVRAQSGASA